jgi:hypothetical protein
MHVLVLVCACFFSPHLYGEKLLHVYMYDCMCMYVCMQLFHACLCIYVTIWYWQRGIYVCVFMLYIRIHVSTYVRMYVCVRFSVYTYVTVYVCLYACMYTRAYICLSVCICVLAYVCLVCKYVGFHHTWAKRHASYCHSHNNWGPRNNFQRFLVPVYYWKAVEKPETDPQLLWE